MSLIPSFDASLALLSSLPPLFWLYVFLASHRWACFPSPWSRGGCTKNGKHTSGAWTGPGLDRLQVHLLVESYGAEEARKEREREIERKGENMISSSKRS